MHMQKTRHSIPSSEDSQGGLSVRPLPSATYVPRTMPPVLGTLDLTATYVMVILFITNVPNAIPGGAATFTYWAIGGRGAGRGSDYSNLLSVFLIGSHKMMRGGSCSTSQTNR